MEERRGATGCPLADSKKKEGGKILELEKMKGESVELQNEDFLPF